MKIRINPILKKELKIGSRSIKLPLAIAGYSLILVILAFFIMESVVDAYYYTVAYNPISYNSLTNGFLYIAYTQITIICLIIPIITASSIAGEREKQTLDIMLTAPISSKSIVLGKLLTALVTVFMFIISSLPAMSVCFLYGGIEWSLLVSFIVASLVIGFFVGSIGVWCSSVFKKTVASVIMTMVIELVFFVLPVVIFGYCSIRVYAATGYSSGGQTNFGNMPLILFLDPAIGFIQTIQTSTSNYDITTLFDLTDVKTSMAVEFLFDYFQYVSMVITMLLGCLFIWLAARKIDAPRSKSKKRTMNYEQPNYGQANQTIHN